MYLNEIAKSLSKNMANVSRELDKLVAENVVRSEESGNRKYYSFNSSSPSGAGLAKVLQQGSLDTNQIFKRKWLLAEEIINVSPWFMDIPFKCFTNQFAQPGGLAYRHLAAVYKDGYHLWFYFDEADAKAVGEHLVGRFNDDVSFMEEVNAKIRLFADRLNELVAKIPESGLDKLSLADLWQYYQAHEDLHIEYYQWGWIPVAADMFGDQLTEEGKRRLQAKGISSEKINESLALLTQPEESSLLKEEQDNLIDIGIKVQTDPDQLELFRQLFQKFKEEDVKFFGLYTHSEEYEAKFEEAVKSLKDRIRPDILSDLQSHYTKYFYTKFIYTEEQGVYSFEYYLKELVRLVSSDPELSRTKRKAEAERAGLMSKRLALMDGLKLSQDERRFFAAWGDFMVTKIYRRYAQLLALYKTTFFLEEMARRLSLSLKELRFMLSTEIKRALFEGQLDREEIKARVKYSLRYFGKQQEVVYSGATARKIVEKYIQAESGGEISELHGQCGCRGQARGRARIINVIKDMAKMAAGDILVSISTQPDLLPAMKKAAAFVTDQGGVTSHAAIVAREMNTPCVIATKVATQVIKDGDELEVDADKGIVKILRRA